MSYIYSSKVKGVARQGQALKSVNSFLTELSTPTSACPGYPNTPEKLDPDLKAYLMSLYSTPQKANLHNRHQEKQ